ncbi:hypothetical protein Q4Q49_06540 [Shewanella sp. SP1S1-7]|uniref:hypothetical protein n=1 Tax=Shewanella sp. SP1S1-7 TaxID=3063536 RepID=UPI00288E8814|nr:hypothetical protein [Shewanella sp. SP1S1-7]MDT3334954.1 hypothetical protein [Shewanella sp. SP1S1-7]
MINIQLEGLKIMYLQEGATWRTLGAINNNDGTKERYAALLSAQMSGKPVMVEYLQDGYDCGKVDYGTPAFLVRTYQ